ncbi:hypothetical protein [Paeniglutamicibacter terrestris]|uniref:Uncharacterized protein n=1 Tax=Paeniglutamicibacter terrestris TaxID=2723403 RepID=A0ABX1G6U2_9MICC|nr:hypothetical protein [Paeniglutamicibacter terrestris]NKG21993.1 hypothetical protein [Paeniglutamicibacter terrestris]
MAVEPNSRHDSDDVKLLLRPGHEITITPQLRLRRAFKNAASLFDEQSQWFLNHHPEIQRYSNSEGTERRLSVIMPAAPEDWVLHIGEVFNHLSSAKDNLFLEIVRKFSEYSDSKIQKQLGGTYWPVCRSAPEWEKTKEMFPFIPAWVLDRIEVFQPFRDRPDELTSPDDNWMSLGASAWARSMNNSDKHSEPVHVTLNHYLNEPLRVIGTLPNPIEVVQRFDDTEPLSEIPMARVSSPPSKGVHLHVDSVGFLFMIRKNLKSQWAPMNQSIWNVIVENQVTLNTVYYGHKTALERAIPWAHDDGVHLSDATYSWTRRGKRRLHQRPNIFSAAIRDGYV